MTRPLDERNVRIALYDGGGAGNSGPNNIEDIISDFPQGLVWRVGPADIREGSLAHFDVVIFPGGSGSKQAAAVGDEGRTRIRQFIEQGGGFIGICAGAYLAAPV